MSDTATFVDTNVLLEAVLQGRHGARAAQDYLGSRSVVISPLTCHLLVYFGRRDGLETDFLLTLVSKHKLTDLGPAEIAWAIKNRQNDDFEDAIQVACAVLGQYQNFATFDKNLARDYQRFIPIELLRP